MITKEDFENKKTKKKRERGKEALGVEGKGEACKIRTILGVEEW